MGNEPSVEAERGVKLQCQGEEHLWTVCLERGPNGEGEGACIFSRSPGQGAEADLCRAAVEVRECQCVSEVQYLYIYSCKTSQPDIFIMTMNI